MFESLSLNDYDTDKTPQYLATYQREFGSLSNDPIALLELGIQRGGSLLLWRDALPKAAIAGLDLNPIDLDTGTKRVRAYQGYQQDAVILRRIAHEMAPAGFDVVIDDASHIGKYTAESFWEIFPNYLKPGGVYIIDDTDSAYRADWSDGHLYAGDFAHIGVRRSDGPSSKVGRVERLRRGARGIARPIAQQVSRLSPALRARLERIYMRIEGSTIQTRFSSHDYGLVGFGKQLVDACEVSAIARRAGLGQVQAQIESVEFRSNQIIVRKAREH